MPYPPEQIEKLIKAYQWDCPRLTEPQAREQAEVLYCEMESMRLAWLRSQARFYSRTEFVDFEGP